MGRWIGVVAVSIVVLLAAIAIHTRGPGKRAAGPNVVGLPLLGAEARLSSRHLGFIEDLQGGLLSRRQNGSTIRRGWVVCSESYVSSTMVQLNTARTTC